MNKFTIRVHQLPPTPLFVVCLVEPSDNGKDIAWFCKLTDAKDYARSKNNMETPIDNYIEAETGHHQGDAYDKLMTERDQWKQDAERLANFIITILGKLDDISKTGEDGVTSVAMELCPNGYSEALVAHENLLKLNKQITPHQNGI